MGPENINSLYSLVQTLHAPLLSSNQLATNYWVEGFLQLFPTWWCSKDLHDGYTATVASYSNDWTTCVSSFFFTWFCIIGTRRHNSSVLLCRLLWMVQGLQLLSFLFYIFYWHRFLIIFLTCDFFFIP